MANFPRCLPVIGTPSTLTRTANLLHTALHCRSSNRVISPRLLGTSLICRRYAQEASPPSALEPLKHGDTHPSLSWPTANNSNPYEIPTPYQIFGMSRDEPYSKRRFYELVKLYHPDREQYVSQTAGSAEQLSTAAKLERYRMVIAANELLSDPRRRRLYDLHGVGWSGKPDFGPSKPRWAETNNKTWSGFDDNVNKSPMQNATWEDWERWHMRHERTHGEQRETFTSNGTFVVILVICAGLATVGESVRMTGLHRTVVHEVEQRHGENSRELLHRRQESQVFVDRDERMRHFLINRGAIDKELQIAPVGQEKEGSSFVPDNEVGRYGK